MSDPNPHIEQAKRQLRFAQDLASSRGDAMSMYLIRAIHELIRHIEEG